MQRLTPRQKQVLYLIAEGKVAKEISAMLHFGTRRTVDYHVRLAMQRLGCTTRSHAVAKLIRMERQGSNCLFS